MTVHNCCNREKDVAAMLYMISSRSVTDGASLSVSQNWSTAVKYIFVDSKLTLICLLI